MKRVFAVIGVCVVLCSFMCISSFAVNTTASNSNDLNTLYEETVISFFYNGLRNDVTFGSSYGYFGGIGVPSSIGLNSVLYVTQYALNQNTERNNIGCTYWVKLEFDADGAPYVIMYFPYVSDLTPYVYLDGVSTDWGLTSDYVEMTYELVDYVPDEVVDWIYYDGYHGDSYTYSPEQDNSQQAIRVMVRSSKPGTTIVSLAVEFYDTSIDPFSDRDYSSINDAINAIMSHEEIWSPFPLHSGNVEYFSVGYYIGQLMSVSYISLLIGVSAFLILAGLLFSWLRGL